MSNIILLGFVSFFNDVATEMVYPLIPLYLTEAFGATPALIGVIEGIAESLASLLRVLSGYLSDKYKKKKALAYFGYSTGLIYKLILILSTSWVGVFIGRSIDRIGKGMRTVPRDVMVGESTSSKHLGKAYGLHQSLDMAGASGGILIAYIILKTCSDTKNLDYKFVFLVSMIPTVIGLTLLAFVKERKEIKKESKVPKTSLIKNFKQLDSRLKLYLLITFIFTLGNSSNTFLILRAKDVGFNDSNTILIYFIFNIVASILGMPVGMLSDKIGRKKLLIIGYLSFSIVYFGFAFATGKVMIIASFILYGVYMAIIKGGVERAFILEISPNHLKGTMLGLQNTIVGIGLLPASIIAGLLWNKFGAKVPFVYGAVLALVSAISLLIYLKKPEEKDLNL